MTDREMLIDACHRIKTLWADIERDYLPAARRLDPFRDVPEDDISNLLDSWNESYPPVVLHHFVGTLSDLLDDDRDADEVLRVLREHDVIELPERYRPAPEVAP